MSRPYILISNDDGVQARGINFLIETLRPIADLLVVAPDSPRSGFGCSITSAAPIHYKKLHEEPGLTVCSCTVPRAMDLKTRSTMYDASGVKSASSRWSQSENATEG